MCAAARPNWLCLGEFISDAVHDWVGETLVENWPPTREHRLTQGELQAPVRDESKSVVPGKATVSTLDAPLFELIESGARRCKCPPLANPSVILDTRAPRAHQRAAGSPKAAGRKGPLGEAFERPGGLGLRPAGAGAGAAPKRVRLS